MSLEVLHEDNHLLVVAKPPGLLVQGDRTGDRSLIELSKSYFEHRNNKTGNVYLGLVHRLDRTVGGVIVLARTSKAAARLSEQFRQGEVQKRYLAVVECHGAVSSRQSAVSSGRKEDKDERLQEEEWDGLWEDVLTKDSAKNRVSIVPPGKVGSASTDQSARTRWRLLGKKRSLALLELQPLTGRSHQLRVQTSSRGMPIFGDHKYGSRHSFSGNIALHAHQLEFRHPTRQETCNFTCPPPESWLRFGFEGFWRKENESRGGCWPS